MIKRLLYFSLLLLLLPACEPFMQPTPVKIIATESIILNPIEKPVLVATPTHSPTKAIRVAIETKEIVPTQQFSLIYSPINGIPLNELSDMVSNPFHPPNQGSDDPHQGVDFSIVDRNSNIAMSGKEVNVIFSGIVVSVMKDRFPDGNAILVYSDEPYLPEGWKNNFVTENLFAWEKNTSLTCPEGWNIPPEKKEQIGLYTLYAHMIDAPGFEIGDFVNSGDKIGAIGMSGNALAPHLHIETRYGYYPDLSGSMAHYDVSATLKEMSNYCRWRVSGWFHLIDPMKLILTN